MINLLFEILNFTPYFIKLHKETQISSHQIICFL